MIDLEIIFKELTKNKRNRAEYRRDIRNIAKAEKMAIKQLWKEFRAYKPKRAKKVKTTEA